MAQLSAFVPKFTFIREAFKEMKQVTWPKPRKIALFTFLVIIFTIIFSYFISLVDAGFLAGLKGLHSQFGNPIAQPQVNLGEGAKILDADGKEIDVTKLLDENDLKQVELKKETKAPVENQAKTE